jgi:tetratricopeptide (TPR) repeat protein
MASRIPGLFLAASLGAAALAGAQAPPAPPPRDALESLATAPLPRAPSGDAHREIDRALAARDWARAETLLADAIAREPKSTALLKTLAGVFLVDRRPLNAAIALKKAEAIEPLDPQSRYQLVLAYVAMGRGDWARPELERLAAAQPSEARFPYWLGRLDYDAGQYASSVRRLEAAIALDPSFVRAFDNLGLCHEALNQPEVAIARYREAIRLNRLSAEPSPWPLLNLGILLRSRGEGAEAETLFREALAADPGFARAHYQLAAVLEDGNQLDAAVRSLEQAVKLDPAYAEPHYALARIHRRQGRMADAEAEIRIFQRLKAPPDKESGSVRK